MNPLRIQFVSSALYQPNHSGTGTYLIGFLSYLRKQGYGVFYTSLDPTPGGRKPWYVIPRELAAFGKIRVHHNLRIGRLLIRRAPATVWFKELLIPIYQRFGKPARAVYQALRGSNHQPVDPLPEPIPTSLGRIPAIEEVSFVHQQSQRLHPDVIIANRIHLAPVLDFSYLHSRASAPLPARVTPKSNEGGSPFASYHPLDPRSHASAGG